MRVRFAAGAARRDVPSSVQESSEHLPLQMFPLAEGGGMGYTPSRLAEVPPDGSRDCGNA